ncbi:hypothetical protein [Fictibacillus norfolkensis]|uniref:Uncharacterized protein n=1 Tax=Fictibacillus norfolkensis TaxID=2762233 RepID=A0ABR8SRE1_9BACL|nr:hypothetical protein [Fictibacillus norfolkensis]MBD7965955.1 hypothetical protein [Fictibacillus norfolkensis]
MKRIKNKEKIQIPVEIDPHHMLVLPDVTRVRTAVIKLVPNRRKSGGK